MYHLIKFGPQLLKKFDHRLYRFQSTLDLTGNDSATTSYDFENPINLAEDEGEDDCEVTGELARLLL